MSKVLIKPLIHYAEGELIKPVIHYAEGELIKPIIHYEEEITIGDLVDNGCQSPNMETGPCLAVQPTVAQLLPENCAGYRWDGTHLMYLDKDGERYTELCNFYIRPIRFLVDVYRYKPQHQSIEIIVGFTNGEQSMICNASESTVMLEKIVKRFPQAYISPAATKAQLRMSEYFAQQVGAIGKTYCYHNVGWTMVNGRYLYLHDGVDGHGKFVCATNKKLVGNPNLSTRDAFVHAIEMLNIARDRDKLVVPWLFAHLGVVYTLFELAGYAPQFLLFIHGQTGSLKTAVAKVLFSMFDGECRAVPATFKDTTTSLEIKMGERCDGTLIIDDFHPASSKGDALMMKSALEFMIRLYGDQVGKSRSTVNLERQIEYRPHGLACITGEYVAGSESSLLRCLLVDLKQGDLEGKLLEKFQKNPSLWSTHLLGFIQFVETQFETLRQTIENVYDQKRAIMARFFKAKRLIDVATQLHMIAMLIGAYGLNIGVFSKDENCAWMEACNKNIVQCIQRSERASKKMQPVVMYLMAIDAMISNGSLKIAKGKSDYCDGNAHYVGFEEDGIIFLKWEEVYRAVVKYWRELQCDFAFQYGEIHAALAARKIIKIHKDGERKKSYTYRISPVCINGVVSRPRMLAVYKDAIKELLVDADEYGDSACGEIA